MTKGNKPGINGIKNTDKKIQTTKDGTAKKSPVTDTHLWMMINNTGFAIYRARELELLEFGLTMEQTTILHILLENNGTLVITDLLTEIQRKPNSIYTLIDRMARIGLVTKEKEPDGKKTLVKISAKGTQIFESITNKSLELAFSPLSHQQKKWLAKLLIKLTVNARELLGLPHKTPLQQYLRGNSIYKPPSILVRSLEDLPEWKSWAILNTARFTINAARQRELAKGSLTVEQFTVLDILSREGKPVSISEIISETMRQPASVYSLINRMGKKKIVKITKPNHSTVSSISISPSGQQLFDAVANKSLDLIFSELTVKQKNQLSKLLEILNQHVRNILGVNYIPPIFNSAGQE